MNVKEFGIREGEKAVDLPARTDASLYFIGRIHTPWKDARIVRKTRANPRPFARSKSIRAGKTR